MLQCCYIQLIMSLSPDSRRTLNPFLPPHSTLAQPESGFNTWYSFVTLTLGRYYVQGQKSNLELSLQFWSRESYYLPFLGLSLHYHFLLVKMNREQPQPILNTSRYKLGWGEASSVLWRSHLAGDEWAEGWRPWRGVEHSHYILIWGDANTV